LFKKPGIPGCATGKVKFLEDGKIDPRQMGTPWRQSSFLQTAEPSVSSTEKNGKPRNITKQNNPKDLKVLNPEELDTFAKAQKANQVWQALLRQQEFFEKSGELISMQVAEEMLFKNFHQIRNSLLALPTKWAPRLSVDLNLPQERLQESLENLITVFLNGLKPFPVSSKGEEK